jgi:hypothetical protein
MLCNLYFWMVGGKVIVTEQRNKYYCSTHKLRVQKQKAFQSTALIEGGRMGCRRRVQQQRGLRGLAGEGRHNPVAVGYSRSQGKPVDPQQQEHHRERLREGKHSRIAPVQLDLCAGLVEL